MRIVVSGGGTAGHVSPVLATVDALRARDNNLRVLYIGQRGGMEAELVRAAGLPYKAIEGGKLRRLPGAGFWRNALQLGNLLFNVRDVVLIAIGTIQALVILSRFRPDAIFNKAGTTGFPVGFAAKLLGIPFVIHEPDITPGLTNKVLSRWASGVAVGFPGEYPAFPKSKIKHTGTPIQPGMLAGQGSRELKRLGFDNRPLLLIVGGSQGAHALNQSVLQILPDLLEHANIHHVVGAYDFERVTESTKGTPGYHADEFLSVLNMADAYAAAEVVVARGGANTLAELAALKKPVVVVPNRKAAAHQLKNAARLADAGAALNVSDEDPKGLLKAVTQLLSSKSDRDRLSAAIASFNTPNAAEELADLIVKQVRP